MLVCNVLADVQPGMTLIVFRTAHNPFMDVSAMDYRAPSAYNRLTIIENICDQSIRSAESRIFLSHCIVEKTMTDERCGKWQIDWVIDIVNKKIIYNVQYVIEIFVFFSEWNDSVVGISKII